MAVGALLIVLGALLGASITHFIYAKRIIEFRDRGPAERLLPVEVRDTLQLTPQQNREVEEILGDYNNELLAIRRSIVLEILAKADDTLSRVESVLSPQQQDTLKRFRAERRSSLIEKTGVEDVLENREP